MYSFGVVVAQVLLGEENPYAAKCILGYMTPAYCNLVDNLMPGDRPDDVVYEVVELAQACMRFDDVSQRPMMGGPGRGRAETVVGKLGALLRRWCDNEAIQQQMLAYSQLQAKYEALLARVENAPRAEPGPSSDFPAGSVFADVAADVAAHLAADVSTDVGGGAGADALLYRSRFPRLELRKSINQRRMEEASLPHI